MFGAVLDHALKVWTQVVGACHGAVDICSDDQDVVRLGILPANAELTFNGLLRLRIAAVPRIDDCFVHFDLRRKMFFSGEQTSGKTEAVKEREKIIA